MNGLKNVRNRRDDALTRVGWDRLETMLADYYRAHGWRVDHVGTGASRSRFDGGIDLKLRKEGEYVLVQCKHWNAKQVTHNAVHELLGIKVNESATGAIVVTSGEFTKAAKEAAARQGHVQLIDGDALRTMLGPQLEAVASATPPPLPRAPTYRGNRKGKQHLERGPMLVGALIGAVLICYALYRFLTFPFFTHRIEVDLPQRTQSVAQSPRASRVPVKERAAKPMDEQSPTVEKGVTGAELEEWKRKNAESMRILEENARKAD
jgi:hypothetical protein